MMNRIAKVMATALRSTEFMDLKNALTVLKVHAVHGLVVTRWFVWPV